MEIVINKIFFGLPEEPYYTEVQLTLKKGRSSVLEFEPRYRYKTIPTRIPAFREGINSCETTLNGQVSRRE
jgi:hypothetical protein